MAIECACAHCASIAEITAKAEEYLSAAAALNDRLEEMRAAAVATEEQRLKEVRTRSIHKGHRLPPRPLSASALCVIRRLRFSGGRMRN